MQPSHIDEVARLSGDKGDTRRQGKRHDY